MFGKLEEIREKRANGEKGFTLIELLVVVVIIGILIAIAIPLYMNYKKGANDKGLQSDVRSAVSVLEQCNADNGAYPSSIGTLASGTYPLTLATNGCDANLNVSTGTALTYTQTGSGTGFTLAGTSTNANGKTYTYSSATGKTVKS